MYEKMMKALSSEDMLMCEKMCEMMGMSGKGCIVVYGSTFVSLPLSPPSPSLLMCFASRQRLRQTRLRPPQINGPVRPLDDEGHESRPLHFRSLVPQGV
jgi:hypothetical protein